MGIVFGSGEERKYQYFAICSSDAPFPKYFPPPLGVQKQISKRGYGIGGLLASRFRVSGLTPTPSPADYDPHLVICSRNQEKSQCGLGFGSRMASGRLTEAKDTEFPGPGNYQVFEGISKVKNTPILTICTPGGPEACHTCKRPLAHDYYRSKKQISLKDRAKVRVPLCRGCFCKSLMERRTFESKEHFRNQFQKARNCSYIHTHAGTTNSVDKTTCSQVKKLYRKEMTLSKYFQDECP